MNEILIIGSIAADTAVSLIENNRDRLKERLSDRFINESFERLSCVNNKNRAFLADILNSHKSDIDYFYEVSDYGVYGGLWDYAERKSETDIKTSDDDLKEKIQKKGVGIEVSLMDIPIEQETVEVCEVFDINPYVSATRDVYIVSVKSSYEIMEEATRNGIIASVIGIETSKKDRIVINNGEKKYLTPTDRSDYFKDGVNDL